MTRREWKEKAKLAATVDSAPDDPSDDVVRRSLSRRGGRSWAQMLIDHAFNGIDGKRGRSRAVQSDEPAFDSQQDLDLTPDANSSAGPATRRNIVESGSVG